MGFTNHIDLSGFAVAVEISKTMAFLGDPGAAKRSVINKHTNPAVYAARNNQLEALQAALATDKKSPFGGVMATSSKPHQRDHRLPGRQEPVREICPGCAGAPGFEPAALKTLSEVMKNLRIIDVSALNTWEKIITGRVRPTT